MECITLVFQVTVALCDQLADEIGAVSATFSLDYASKVYIVGLSMESVSL